jgi:hypothetical protein
LFIQSSSFGLSAGLGVAAIMFITVATPVGWVILIAGTSGAALGVDYITKQNAGDWYDGIMSLLE